MDAGWREVAAPPAAVCSVAGTHVIWNAYGLHRVSFSRDRVLMTKVVYSMHACCQLVVISWVLDACMTLFLCPWHKSIIDRCTIAAKHVDTHLHPYTGHLSAGSGPVLPAPSDVRVPPLIRFPCRLQILPQGPVDGQTAWLQFPGHMTGLPSGGLLMTSEGHGARVVEGASGDTPRVNQVIRLVPELTSAFTTGRARLCQKQVRSQLPSIVPNASFPCPLHSPSS